MAAPLICSQCGKDAVLRSQCLSPGEHILSALFISPFRCQLCSHRFLAFRWGREYHKHPLDRREHRRIPVRLSLAFSGGRIHGEGTVINLSLGGCLIETNTVVQQDDIFHLQISLFEHQPPVKVTAIVRSVHARSIGLKFLRMAPEERRLEEFLAEQRPPLP